MRVAFIAVTLLLLGAVSAPPPAGAQHPMGGGSSAVGQELAASAHRTLGCFNCHRRARAARPRGTHAWPVTPPRRSTSRKVLMAWRFGVTPSVPTCVSCHGSHGVKSARSSDAPTSRSEQPATRGTCHRKASAEFLAGVHGEALLRAARSPTPACTTCHGRHLAATSATPRSPVSTTALPDTCGACHVIAHLQFGRSVHGSAVARSVPHAPTCATCRGAHAIDPVTAAYAPTSGLRVAGETCARCHASVRIAEMHDLPVKVVEDFRGSYHRVVGARGDRRVANCASCRGAHEIRPSSNPFSRTYPANLARTCGGRLTASRQAKTRDEEIKLAGAKAMFWGVAPPWNLLLGAGLGVWLILTPSVLGNGLGRPQRPPRWRPDRDRRGDRRRPCGAAKPPRG